jgi:hypothetical protein
MLTFCGTAPSGPALPLIFLGKEKEGMCTFLRSYLELFLENNLFFSARGKMRLKAEKAGLTSTSLFEPK